MKWVRLMSLVLVLPVCLVTLAGLFDRLWWILEDMSAFRVQYAVVLALGTILLAAQRAWKTAALTAACTLVNVLVIGSLYLGGLASEVPSGAESQRVRAVLFNLNSRNDSHRRVVEYLLKQDADVLALLEVNHSWASSLEPLYEHYPHRLIRPREDNFGIAFFSAMPARELRVSHFGNAGVPSITASLEIRASLLTVVASHPVPPVSATNTALRNMQVLELSRFLAASTGPTMLMGDLNMTPWSPIFVDLIDQSGLHNTGLGWGLQATWPAGFLPLRVPLDHVLVSSEITVVNRKIGPNLGSDHLPVIVDFQVR